MHEHAHSFSWRSGLLDRIRPSYSGIRLELTVVREDPSEAVDVTVSHATDLVPPMSFSIRSGALIRLRARGIWTLTLTCKGHDDLELRFDARHVHDKGRSLLANRILRVQLVMKAAGNAPSRSGRAITGQIDDTGLHWTVGAAGSFKPSHDQPPSLLRLI